MSESKLVLTQIQKDAISGLKTLERYGIHEMDVFYFASLKFQPWEFLNLCELCGKKKNI